MEEDLFKKYKVFLSVADESDEKEERYLLERDGVSLLPRDCTSVIIGEKTSGKSQAATVLMAAVLGDNSFGFTPGVKDSKVVYIDTYHGKQWDSIFMRRLHRLLKCGDEEFKERVAAYKIIGTGLEERLDLVEGIIKVEKPTLVVIDQIEDLISDPSSQAFAAASVRKLKQLPEKYRCNIMGIIYEYVEEEEYTFPFRVEWEYKSRDIFTVKKRKSQGSETFILTHKESKGPVMRRPMKWSLNDGRIIPLPTGRRANSDCGTNKTI